jgi:hypothetical protein
MFETKDGRDRGSVPFGAVGLCRDLSDVAKGGDGAKSEAAIRESKTLRTEALGKNDTLGSSREPPVQGTFWR